MSSRGLKGPCAGSGLFVGEGSAVDLVADAAAEGAYRFSLCVSGRASVFDVVAGWAWSLHLRDRDPVHRGVELPVATAVEAVPVAVARPDGNRCSAVVTGERSLGPEAADAGRLAQDLGRSERAT